MNRFPASGTASGTGREHCTKTRLYVGFVIHQILPSHRPMVIWLLGCGGRWRGQKSCRSQGQGEKIDKDVEKKTTFL